MASTSIPQVHLRKECLYCGREFVPRNNNARKFCADACRFWAKVDRRGDAECWLWTGAKGHFGHGQLTIRPGRSVHAHRISWEMASGPIPDGLCVLHHCDVPACVNPSHLFLGTSEENFADMRQKGRGRNPPKPTGSLNGHAKLTDASVLAIRKSGELAKVLAARYGVSPSAISLIRSRKTWTHI